MVDPKTRVDTKRWSISKTNHTLVHIKFVACLWFQDLDAREYAIRRERIRNETRENTQGDAREYANVCPYSTSQFPDY